MPNNGKRFFLEDFSNLVITFSECFGPVAFTIKCDISLAYLRLYHLDMLSISAVRVPLFP